MLKQAGCRIRNSMGLVVLAVLFPTLLFGETIINQPESKISLPEIEITEAVWEQEADVFTEAYNFYTYVNEELADSLSTGIQEIPSNSSLPIDSFVASSRAMILPQGKRKQTLLSPGTNNEFATRSYPPKLPHLSLVAFVSHKFLRYLALRLNSPPPGEQKTGVL